MAVIQNTECLLEFGKFICDRRKSLSLHQSEVATMVGIKQPYYSKIERGERNVDLVLALKICQALNLNLSDFVLTYLTE